MARDPFEDKPGFSLGNYGFIVVAVILAIVAAVELFLIFRLPPENQPPAVSQTETDPAPSSPEPSLPAVPEDWRLILVNEDNPLPADYEIHLAALNNGLEFDERAIGFLEKMISDARDEGLFPVVASAYRSVERQWQLYENKIMRLMGQGLNREEAEMEARKVVAYPGTSEHNLGLAADLVAYSYQHLDDAQGDTAEIQWLHEHCWEYGFILRYPKDKSHITGVIYEPWHFRYVGQPAAQEIMEQGLCLEEYLANLGKENELVADPAAWQDLQK